MAAKDDPRFKHITKMVAAQLGTPEFAVTPAMVDKGSNATWVQEFMAAGAEGVEPRMALVFFLQKKDGAGEPQVYMASPEAETLSGKCCYVVRLSDPFKPLPEKDVEDQLNFGTIAGNGAAMQTLMRLVSEMFNPLLAVNQFAFKKKMAPEQVESLQSATSSFCVTLGKGIESLEMAMTLPKPENIHVEARPAAIAAAAADASIVDAFEECVSEWADITTKLLDEEPKNSRDDDDDDDIGPRTELAWWRKRATKLNSICDDLKGEECQQIMLVLQACKSRKYKVWRAKNNQITDALNEAKDNVKYLSTLDKYIEPLYAASPPEVIESLSGLLNNLRMMHAIARYYATPERMTALFAKITEQMIVNCRAWVTKEGVLWEQDTASLLSRLQTCHSLFQHYRTQYEATRDKLRENPQSKQFEFSENVIFSKSNLFQRRVEKLIDLFTTVDQFTTLSNHNLEGMENLMQNFFQMVSEFKRKPYDLFDFQANQFDRDYLEFLANIHELESSLQGFINSSFEHITSTEAAMLLLDQLRHMLQRDSLKDDLESKRLTIFQHFLGDLEVVSRSYEKLKNNPPLVRNVPPVTGNVLWARQLMRRIESPMQQFRNHQELMDLKDSKKAVKVYNKIARTVVEFEALWELAWVRGIEAAKSGLQSTLIVRHPQTEKLYVNFDHQILELMKEAKCLRRLGHEIPESAKMVLMMEDKYKHHYNLLSFALSEYERLLANVPEILAPLLRPHMAELQCVINPGLVTLTWTSMNIASYLTRFHSEMLRFSELIDKLKDIVSNRLARNQNIIKGLPLIEMPEEGTTLPLDKFVAIQQKYAAEQTIVMAAKSIEIEAAVRDLIKQITEYELSYVPQEFDPSDIHNLWQHFSSTSYRSVLDCTRVSLDVLKTRIAPRSLATFLFIDSPIFEINVEMTSSGSVMNPGLGEIQDAINMCARAMLGCSKALPVWSNDEGGAAKRVFDVISRDKEVVRVVLLLTGAIEGTKRQVVEYLHSLSKYDYLWRDDKKTAYEAFMAKNPSLEDFEGELRRYDTVEAEIMRIPDKHNIGALSLDTTPLKTALSKEAKAWKKQYAQNLHGQAKVELETITQWIETHKRYLSREITDLEDVRNVMGYLTAIREKETMLDWEFGPVEEKYAMLMRYNVEVPKEEQDLVTDLAYSWKKLKKDADEITDKLGQEQTQYRKGLIRNVRMFVVDVSQFRTDFEANGPGVPGLPPADANERLLKFKRLYEERERKWDSYVAGEKLFGLPVTQYPELEKTKAELQLLDKLYGLYQNVNATLTEYYEMAWNDVCGFTETPKGQESNISQMVKKLEEFQLACKKMPKELRGWDAYIELKKTVDDFLETLPLVEQLANPALRPRHWKALEDLTGSELNVMSEHFKLSTLLDAGILAKAEDVEEIAGSAVKELAIEGKLNDIANDWVVRNLTFAPFKARGNIILNTGATFEMMEVLEESQMGLGSMLASRFVVPFKDFANEWVDKLSSVSEILEQWTTVQAMWQYLEAVFTSGDIAKQLPQESKRFQGIDKNWVKIMSKGNETPNVINYIYGNDVLKQLLPHMIEQLELCQKALSGYLDQKRAAFPRFFFVADATLLEVLSQGSNPQAIQPHLQSCFDSVVYAEFGKKDYASCIEVLQSGDGQTIKLVQRVKAEGNIEEWLDRLLKEMQNTVNRIISYVAADCEVMDTETMTHKYQAQISLIGIQFKWTTDSEDALYRAKSEKGIVKATNKKHQQRLNDLVGINMRPDQELSQYGKWTRRKVETMIIVDVHQRDVFVDIEIHRVKDPEDFEWQKQARCYWDFDDDVAKVSIADVDFPYTNEYLGVKERLCITPLTDRCYVTLSQALGMFLGGAPAGPAGTGKTETTKDMGCTLGKFVMVTNCGDQMDFRSLGGIYKGAAMAGLWSCFDEFNRINLDVLSVAAQQVGSVLMACKMGAKMFQFTDGQTVNCDSRVGYFITMNPGYAGRQELPENLKSQHRGVTMMVPDRQIIMQVKLTGAGYEQNAICAKKFNVLYRLCEEQLSKQAHYDFGLRNILAVLRTCGSSKRDAGKDPGGTLEPMLVMRTLRDMNLSKFVAEDVPLFLALIEDLFPGLKAAKMQHPLVEPASRKAVRENNLQEHPDWVNKIIQVYEMCLVRHSLMLVGPSGTGKSKIVTVLQQAFQSIIVPPGELVQPMIGQPQKFMTLNPKAILSGQMFGTMDVAAGEWNDGIFAQLWRRANKDKKNFTWLVLDGPVDAIWIENMNTVMDDNKLLTLANNDRIPMLRPNVTLHFEVEDLRNASPATVSRAGIIYVSEADLGWKPYITSWIASRTKDGKDLEPHVEKLFAGMMNFVRIECKSKMSMSEIQYCTSCTNLIDALLHPLADPPDGDGYERFVIYSMLWSMAGVLESADRAKVDKFLRTLTANLPEVEHPDTIFEYKIDTEDPSYPWTSWGSLIPGWTFDEGPVQLGKKFASLLIPTIDSVRCEYNILLSVSRERGVILVGGPGTAKTSIILSVLNAANPATHTFKKMSFSQATTPSIYQRQIESSVEKRQGKTFAPPNNKKMYCFIDDISMPLINDWGDQITLEIIRQMVEEKGFYNLDKPGEFKGIVDVLILGAMLHPGAGKNDIPNRAKRHFHVMNVTLPSTASINQIFGAMGASFFSYSSDDAIKEMSQELVTMTISIWDRVKTKLLPTPAKFHYLFNLRDLSRVFQGIFAIDVEKTLDSSYTLLALWKHECARVFSDKLVDHKDKGWFAKEIFVVLDAFTTKFGADIEKLKQQEGEVYFVDFMRDADEDPETGELLPAPKVYEPLPFESFDEAREKAKFYMKNFNEAYKLLKMELVFFHDALEHLTRITRLFGLSRGCAMLVGVGGSGKQSLTRLASFIANATCFQITLTKTYNQNNLLEDFKPLYRRAGCQAKPTVFMLTDKEIKDEGFLEFFNIFLNTGELPNLFPRDELDAVIGECREKYQAMYKGSEPTVDELWAFFIERVRSNLHLSLCFSPVGVKLSRRAQMFPGLINGTTIDWFLTWPEEALTDVATYFIGSFDKLQGDASVRQKLIRHMGAVHAGMNGACETYFERYRRNTYVTPKSFLGFIEEYKGVYVKKLDFVQVLADSINTGLDKLREAAKDVEQIKIEVREKEKSLVIAQEKGAIMVQEITASTAKAEKKKAEAGAIKESVAAEAVVIGKQKDAVEEDLLAAKPALDDAENALKAITAKDIGLLKQLKQPPDLVKRVFDMVLILFQKDINPSAAEPNPKHGGLQLAGSWNFSLPMMADISFLPSLERFNKDAINDETVELLYPYLAAADMTPDDARKVASALAGLCTWARAMALYVGIAKVVKPKMEGLKVAEGKLKAANAKLAKAQSELDQVAAELDEMQRQFDEAMATKKALQDDADACQKKMDAANRLIGGLAGERSRWEEQSGAFADEIKRLAGDVALACAFITYVGPYNAEYRKELTDKLFTADCIAKGVPCTQDLGISLFLVDAATIGDWALEGLPSDDLSVENGIMVTRSKKWPLMIDPQSQGLGWIKSREAKNSIKSTQLIDKRFRNHLEDAMAFGTPLMIENVEEEIDPVLDPVLNKEIQRKGRNLIIQLADKECEYSDQFSLFLCTKLANPHYSPEIFAQLTIINFTVTMGGLEQQLLSRVVQMERPELEEQKAKLVEEVNTNKKLLKGLEDDLLYRLANSTGNLLDDVELIEVLQKSKTTSVEVNEKLTIAEDTDIRINTAREEYRPSAIRGALLYFLVVDMAAINNMYMVSLQQFLELHDFSVNNSENAPIVAKRIVNIIAYMTNYVTRYMHRGLFERHKKIWTLMLAMKIETVADKLSPAYIGNLLKGGGALDIKSEKPVPASWIPEAVWLNIIALSRTVQMLRDLPDNIERFIDAWKAWYDYDAPETQPFPDYNERLDQFEKMLLVRAIREDRALIAIDTYIQHSIGRDYLLVEPLDLAKLVDEASAFVPMITILSTGSDPTGKIQDLARKRKKSVLGISMGQGQEPAARKLLEQGIAEGVWVLLQNCHLGLSFMGECKEWVAALPKLEEATPGAVNPVFRLWITAEPHPEFPVGLLQLAIKFTNEAPAGIMAGVKNTYNWLNQDLLDSVTDPKWKTMLFALAFMHTIVQERRKFGPLGFNILYEFSQADLSACVNYMQNHLNLMETKKRPVDWITVNYMVCDVQYGGKITDDWDRRLFNTYGRRFLAEGCLAPDFRFVEGNDTYYIPPVNNDIEVYRKYIESLPLVDDPEVFGLHGNADLAYRTAQTKTTLTTIQDIQPKEGGGGGGMTREEIVLKMVDDLQAKLPPDYNGEATKAGIKALGGLGKPLNICLKQEIDRMQMVLKALRTILSDLKLAIAGTIVMSPILAGSLDALFNAKVPDPWAKVMPVSLPLQPNIGVWFVNMTNRAEQLTTWLKNGRPTCFWLTGFFNPSGFLTASRQEVCRAHSKDGWALDDCVDTFDVLKQEKDDVRAGPSEGIYIWGLSLDGARWDKGRNALTDSEPKVRFSPLPVLHIAATGEKVKLAKGEIRYVCPVYTCPARAAHGTQLRNYISQVELRSEEVASKWTLRAVCLLTTTD